MSFITKRERVFNEYDLFDLPARNEGKLKTYSSCTDARAWSHFCSDKSDHLVEIIKRNNEICRPKYVPTDVIVNTLMGCKNTEINRLKRKIEEFEQLLAAYDHLELTPEQKNEIATAHAAIKAANKELDELCLDLDLSGFTEGIDSEAFETGKSRGDEVIRPKEFEMETSRGTERSMDVKHYLETDTKINQTAELTDQKKLCPCDASTDAQDPRIEEMQDVIINKDAKMNAMRNTIAVLENDVCEPYCIYAHINTALEKIYSVLCQNEKYKQYLDLMTSGKDLRYVDIKVRIFYKLKVLEKFCGALITPCSKECSCYHAEIISRVETGFTLSPEENIKVNIDSKRAYLVADIMSNVEMKEILCKKNSSVIDEDISADEDFSVNNSNIEDQNLNRLKNLQTSYEELLICYEELKYEKDCVTTKCRKYIDLEKEVENLRMQLNSYNCLINEKEYFKKRSEDLDLLKEKCLVLADETLNLETQYRAQVEINNAKSARVEQLRSENTALQKKLNDASTLFEKEKHALICKLSECECKIICQNQQIETLSAQMNTYIRGMERNTSERSEVQTEELLDQINSQKEEIKNLKASLFYRDEETNEIRNEFQDIINTLKLEIDNWKRVCEEAIQRNDYLEKVAEMSQGDFQKVIDENNKLIDEVKIKTKEIEDLKKDSNDKSLKLNKLSDEMEYKEQENKSLLEKMHELANDYSNKIYLLEREREETLSSLKLATHESELLLGRKSYDVLEQEQMANECKEIEEYGENREVLTDENEAIVLKQSNSSFSLTNEIHRFRAINTENIKNFLMKSKESVQNLEEKGNEILESKHQQIENLSEKVDELKEHNKNILEEKKSLLNELQHKSDELIAANNQIEELKNEFAILVGENENLKEDIINMKHRNEIFVEEKNNLENSLLLKSHEVQNLSSLIDNLKKEKHCFSLITDRIKTLEQRICKLHNDYDNLIVERDNIQGQVALQADTLTYLQNKLKDKTENDNNLLLQIKTLEEQQIFIQNKVNSLESENLSLKTNLKEIKTENNALKNKIEHQAISDNELLQIKSSLNQLKFEKEKLESDLQTQLALVSCLEKENKELQETTTNLIAYNNDIENALISTRDELLLQDSSPRDLVGDIKKEMKEIKNEKDNYLKQTQDLLEKLTKSDKLIASLYEDISDRDDKITILENQVNELGDEVKILQTNLATMIDLGEEIDDRNHEIDLSLKQMEAHHSKATHNMKIELGKLMDQNTKLEEQLSATKIDIETSAEENMIRLNDEREIIVTDIKQLEIRCVGDSTLSPDNCCIKNILNSLERISNYIDARNNSSQLVLSKADEAKKIVEKEKQKILKEKEEAIKDKMCIQKQLNDLKESLELQISKDKTWINDLEAELLNQKLIIEKINESKENYVSKLKEEMCSLENLYTNALAKIRDLEEKINEANEVSKQNKSVIERVKEELKIKCQEVKDLENMLAVFKNKKLKDFEVQTDLQKDLTSNLTQTENLETKKVCDHQIFEDDNKKDELPNINTEEYNDLGSNRIVNDVVSNIHPPKVNEVQILTANLEPSLGFVKNAYLHYKLKRLSFGGMELCSVSCISEDDTFDSEGKESIVGIEKYAIKFYDSNLSQIELADRESKHKVLSIDNQSFNLKSKSENDKSQLNSASSTSAKKMDDDVFIAETKGKDIDPSVNLNDNKDFITIYRDSDSDESHVDIKQNREKENVNFSNQGLKRTAMQNLLREISSTKLASVGTLLTFDKNHYITERNSVTKKGKKKITNIHHPQENHSISETSLSSYSINKETLQKQNEYYNISMKNGHLITRSLNSLISVKDSAKLMYPNENITHKVFDTISKNKLDIYLPRQENLGYEITNFTGQRQDNAMVPGDKFLSLNHKNEKHAVKTNNGTAKKPGRSFEVQPVLFGTKNDITSLNKKTSNTFDVLRGSRSNVSFNHYPLYSNNPSLSRHPSYHINLPKESKLASYNNYVPITAKLKTNDVAVMAKLDCSNEKIKFLTSTLENVDRDYTQKIRAIKAQYDNNIKKIMIEHNQGVQSLQSLHEETLQDILKVHENETDNLRTMSIDAMRRVDKLEKENMTLKAKLLTAQPGNLDEEPTKMSSTEIRSRGSRYGSRVDIKTLTKTNIEEFSNHPKFKSHGLCTCSPDINVSDTIRNIFEQVDVDQRRMAEQAYIKYIANKIMTASIEALDVQELSFLHYKICRTWKTILRKEEILNNRIDSLEAELVNKQRQTQKHIAELDRKVAKERRRLQEVREAVCRDLSIDGSVNGPHTSRSHLDRDTFENVITSCSRNLISSCNMNERLPAGDVPPEMSNAELHYRRANRETNRHALPAKVDVEERREKRPYCDERPTRLRRSTDRPITRSRKK